MANVSKRIPSNTQPTWQANINGKEYEYQSGITADVPDEVAALIDFIDESAPKRDPKAAQRAIEDEVTQIVKDNFDGGVGYEETVETVMLPETSFEVMFEDGYGQALLSDSFTYTFEAGKEYTITLDGVANTYTAVDDGYGGVSIFNTGFADYDSSMTEFQSGNGWLCAANEGYASLDTKDTSFRGTHTIKIGYSTTVVRKIDSRYIPTIGKTLYADSKSNLFTDFDPNTQDSKPQIPLTYEEAFSLCNSGIPVFIFDGNYRCTVYQIRSVNYDSTNGTGYQNISFDVMYGSSSRTYSVTNPNYVG